MTQNSIKNTWAGIKFLAMQILYKYSYSVLAFKLHIIYWKELLTRKGRKETNNKGVEYWESIS